MGSAGAADPEVGRHRRHGHRLVRRLQDQPSVRGRELVGRAGEVEGLAHHRDFLEGADPTVAVAVDRDRGTLARLARHEAREAFPIELEGELVPVVEVVQQGALQGRALVVLRVEAVHVDRDRHVLADVDRRAALIYRRRPLLDRLPDGGWVVGEVAVPVRVDDQPRVLARGLVDDERDLPLARDEGSVLRVDEPRRGLGGGRRAELGLDGTVAAGPLRRPRGNEPKGHGLRAVSEGDEEGEGGDHG